MNGGLLIATWMCNEQFNSEAQAWCFRFMARDVLTTLRTSSLLIVSTADLSWAPAKGVVALSSSFPPLALR